MEYKYVTIPQDFFKKLLLPMSAEARGIFFTLWVHTQAAGGSMTISEAEAVELCGTTLSEFREKVEWEDEGFQEGLGLYWNAGNDLRLTIPARYNNGRVPNIQNPYRYKREEELAQAFIQWQPEKGK